MQQLLKLIDYLIVLKGLNRDFVAESIGMTRANMLSALKGRRALPSAALPPLCKVAGLGDDFRLQRGQVHLFRIKAQAEHVEKLEAVIKAFATPPLQHYWILQAIGEGLQASTAYVIEDSQQRLLLLRNDDGMLQKIITAQTSARMGLVARLFTSQEACDTTEIHLATLENYFAHGVEEKDLRKLRCSTMPVCTWTRLRTYCEERSITADKLYWQLMCAEAAEESKKNPPPPTPSQLA